MSLKCQLLSSDYILAPTLLLYWNVKLSIFLHLSQNMREGKSRFTVECMRQLFYYLLITVLFSIEITINPLFPPLYLHSSNAVTRSKLLSHTPLHSHLAFLKTCPCNSLTYSVLLCPWLSLFIPIIFKFFKHSLMPDIMLCTQFICENIQYLFSIRNSQSGGETVDALLNKHCICTSVSHW